MVDMVDKVGASGVTAYINARLLDASCGRDEVGGIVISGGKIVDIGVHVVADNLASGIDIFDCGGLCLSAGFLDMRVHLSASDLANRDSNIWRVAAAGGVTGLVCIPDDGLCLDDSALIDLMTRFNRPERVKLYCYGAMTQGLCGEDMSQIGLLQEAGAVAFSDGHRAVMRSDVMVRLLFYAKNFDALLVQHAEDLDLVRGGVMNMGEMSTRLGLPGIAVQAESVIVGRDLELLRLTGGRYHVGHVSSGAAVRLIREAKLEGLDVSCDTAPHYFALSEDAIENYRTFAKVSPPLRHESDRIAICEALSDGTIDVIASDHSPCSEDLKRLPFASAASGIIGLETLLSVSLGLVGDGYMSLLDMVGCLTYGPSRRLRLDSGSLSVGSLADIVIFDSEVVWCLAAKDLEDTYENTAFDGHELRGRVVRTMCGGVVVYDNSAYMSLKRL